MIIVILCPLPNLQTQFSRRQIIDLYLPVFELVEIWGKPRLCGVCDTRWHTLTFFRFVSLKIRPSKYNRSMCLAWREQANRNAAWTQFDFQVGTDLNENTCARIHVWFIGHCANENEFIVFVWHSNYIISFPQKICFEIIVLCVRACVYVCVSPLSHHFNCQTVTVWSIYWLGYGAGRSVFEFQHE